MHKRQKSNGLNAVGKPHNASYDPEYRLHVPPRIGRLRALYGRSMRFVGDDQSATDEKRRRRRRLRPAPLLELLEQRGGDGS
jgi:hypothetical protein